MANYADSGDHELQVGQILPSGDRNRDRQTASDVEPGTSTNIRSGNATVGEQADVITGPIVITWNR